MKMVGSFLVGRKKIPAKKAQDEGGGALRAQ